MLASMNLGVKEFSKALNATKDKSLTLINAPTGCGKTYTSVKYAIGCAKGGKQVVIVCSTLEEVNRVVGIAKGYGFDDLSVAISGLGTEPKNFKSIIVGKRKFESGFKTKVEAERAMTKMLHEIENGFYLEFNKSLTFQQLTDKFLKYHVEIQLKESTYDTYMGFLRVHILPMLGNMKIVEITPNTINEYIRLKQKETKLSNCSINKHTVLIKGILNHAVDNGLIIKNPAEKVKKLKEAKIEQGCLTQKEIFVTLEVAKKHYPDFYPLLFTAIFTGMRQGEILALTWDKINFVEGYIKVDRGVYKNKFCTPKTTTSNRKINAPTELIKVLKEWRLRCPHSDLNLVFPNESGNFMDSHNLKRRKFKAVLRRAGVTEIRFHDLRHTFASVLLANNAHPKYVQHQMGHSSIKITMDIYSHLIPEAHQQGVDTLNRILDTPQEEIKKFGT